MLTTEDKEEIKRLVGELIAAGKAEGPLWESAPRPASPGEHKHAGDSDRLQSMAAQIRDLIVNEGFTELTFINPKTGEKRVLKTSLGSDPIVEVAARAMEVFGTREKALRWLRTPIRSLGDQTPISLLNSPEGVAQVQDTLGRIEHGVW